MIHGNSCSSWCARKTTTARVHSISSCTEHSSKSKNPIAVSSQEQCRRHESAMVRDTKELASVAQDELEICVADDPGATEATVYKRHISSIICVEQQ